MEEKNMLNHTIEFLDECWAACLGCSVAQLRDGGRHVVATPQSTGSMKRPYPLKPESISLVTYGQGWILSVPPPLLEQAKALCLRMSFSDIAEEGDQLEEELYRRRISGDENDEQESTEQKAVAYELLQHLVEPLQIRGWSHYFHWYCDSSLWNDEPISKNVHPIREDDPQLWEQWLKWPGPVGGPGAHKHFEFSDTFGYVLDSQLVSVAQLFANSQDFAWEFGPSTLPKFRCRGFATEVAKAATKFILEHGRIAWYYYDHYNHASARIPQKLRYFLYSEGLFSHNR